MLKLYGTRRSRAFRCLWMLEECGVEYELVKTQFASADTQSQEFLALNPNGKVPVLVDDEVVLWESLAINCFLAQKYGQQLLPKSAALTMQWTCWAMGELEGPHDAANRSSEPIDLERLDRSVQAIRRQLERHDYLLGSSFSVVDLNVAAVLLRPQYRPIAADDPAIGDWFARCIGRDALARATTPAQG